MSKRKKAGKTNGFFEIKFPALAVQALLVVWFIIVWKNYFAHYPKPSLRYLPYFFHLNVLPVFSQFAGRMAGHVYKVAITAGIFISFYGWGILLDRDEDFLIQTGLGISLTVLVFSLLGSLGLFYRELIFLFTVPGIFFFAKWGRKNVLPDFHREKLLKILIVLILAMIFICALPPATFYDSLVYHLGNIQHWLNSHKIAPVRYVNASYLPSNIEMLFSFGVALKMSAVSRLTHFGLSILVIIAIYEMAKKLGYEKAGFLAALIYISTPLIANNACKTYIEQGLSLFEILFMLCLLLFMKKKNKKYIFYSGIFLGTAIGGRYTSLVSLPALVFALAALNLKNIKALKSFTIKLAPLFLAGVLILSGLWYARNTFLVKNPFFSVFSNFIGQRADLKYVPGKKLTSGEAGEKINFRQTFLAPWDVTMGKYEEGLTGTVYLFLLPLLVFVRKYPVEFKFIILYLVPYYLFECTMGRNYIRYVINIFPYLAILFSVFIVSNEKKLKLTYFMVLFLAIINWNYLTALFKSALDPWPYVTGAASKLQYLDTQRQTYPTPYYPAMDWCNKNLPKKSKILFQGEARGYYCRLPYIANMAADKNPLVEWTKRAKNGDELYGKLKKEGVTHIFLNLWEAVRLWGYKDYDWTGEERKPFDEFWDKYVVPVYRWKYLYVYKITEQPHKKTENLIRELPEIVKKSR